MTPQKKRVVIIDDEADVVIYLSAMLSDNDYEVYSAGNGREGLEAVRTYHPDLICLDILMPGETGVSLFRKIRFDPELAGIPVLIISGMNYSESVKRDNDVSSDDPPPPEGYLEKPVMPDQFLDTVRSMIG